MVYFMTLYATFFGFFIPYSMWAWGFKGVGYMLSVYFVGLVLDALTSDATKINLDRIQKNGYSLPVVFAIVAWNFSTFWISTYFLIQKYCLDTKPYFSIGLIAQLLLSLAALDVTFFFVHRWMHQSKPEWHVLHHCCKITSFTTSILFHPLDLMLEFAVPMTVVTTLNLFVFNDPFCWMLSVAVGTTLLILDHDPHVGLPHQRHHLYMNSDYFAFTGYAKHDPLDKVRKIIQGF